MNLRLAIIAAACLLAPLLPSRAGDTAPPPDTAAPAVDTSSTPSNLKTTYEISADASYVGDTSTNFGYGNKGTLSEQDSHGKLVVSPQWNDGPIYRFGLECERYNFGFSSAAPLPDILQSENLVLGVDFALFNSWLVRVEADPGLYGDSRAIGFRDFNVPFEIGGSYIASETLQWVIGLEVDVNREYPVLPGVGVHWTITDNLVLDAILPSPRLEYDLSKNLTAYLGGDFKDGTYTVAPDFGAGVGSSVQTSEVTYQRQIGVRLSGHGPPTPIFQTAHKTETSATKGPNLNGTIVEYDEIRVGAGFSWKASKALTIEMEGGYLPYREFNFQRSGTHFGNDAGAAYAQVSLDTQF
jgi:hypothetical protein